MDDWSISRDVIDLIAFVSVRFALIRFLPS